ncbi:conserved Plasmodium protein, unknown function [Plasmodium malariae]|uniref:Uncharacterized protein n=1 Tax=Plasmodium malariae TaxID=5858 RepID=A0A1D3TE63_PLAMA|nr:conserved Plasmodium protein, unknown function [Plasmodium malariae]SCP03187.1 conserved Plasmodium protein, unknown function [Plasmodium malariae]
MDISDDKLTDDSSFNADEIKKKKYVEIFYENECDIYSPCIDVEGVLCVISDKGDILRYKLVYPKRDEKSNNLSAASSSEEIGDDEDEHDKEYFDSIDEEKTVMSIRNEKKNTKYIQEEKYFNTDIMTECLCADNDYNFYIFDPITRGLMVIDKDKKIELYTDEYEDQSFKGISHLFYDKKGNILYVVDSGNINEENKCNLYYINKDIETMISIDVQNISYVKNICIYQKDRVNDIYVCLTKENRILRLIKKGNSYIKTDFLYLNGAYSPLFICTDNTNFILLLKDLSDYEKRGKIIEINSNAEVINSFYIAGNQFNGICYDNNMKKYFIVEKNIIYTY